MTWYKGGLKFKCQRSGNCCTGAPGFVWVTDEECKAISDLMEIPLEDFLENCTHVYHGKRSLKEFEDGDCIFFDKGCTIYDKRPNQCRTWPFWDSNLESKRDWEIAARNCPGMNQGNHFDFETIEAERTQQKDL